MDSKEYSWQYIVADTVLCEGECELISAISYPSATDNEVDFYNGISDKGSLIAKVTSEVKRSLTLNLRIPVYCNKGLFVDIVRNVTGVFVQWRKL